jgi:hypothetical protein
VFWWAVDPRDVEGMERLATLCRQYGGDNDSPATLIGPWHQFFNSGFATSTNHANHANHTHHTRHTHHTHHTNHANHNMFVSGTHACKVAGVG